MPDFISLTCPTCGGKLQITNNIERFACGYCGNEHLVKRSGGIVTIEPVIEGLKKIQEGTDKTASELAIRRVREDIDSLFKNLLQFFKFERTSQGDLILTNQNQHINALYDLLYDLSKPRGRRLVNGTYLPHAPWEYYDTSELVWNNVTDTELEEAMNLALTKKKSPDLISYIQQMLALRKQIKQKQEELKYHEAIVQK
jgi:DNA-directed RNA polymerase subunit RPC12/RpoP